MKAKYFAVIWLAAFCSLLPLAGQTTNGGQPSTIRRTDAPLAGFLAQQEYLLEELFGVEVALFCYEDTEPGNAYASPAENPFDGLDGKVAIGKRLLKGIAMKLNTGKYVIMALLAHEFSHIAQFKFSPDLTRRQCEQHADYFAGYYLGRRYPELSIPLRNSIAEWFFQMGDEAALKTHGSPNQRMKAFMHGFNDGDLSFEDVWAKAEAWASER